MPSTVVLRRALGNVEVPADGGSRAPRSPMARQTTLMYRAVSHSASVERITAGWRRRPPAGRHRLRGQHLFPAGTAGCPARDLRAEVDPVERLRHAARLRSGAAAARSRPHRRPAGDVVRAYPDARGGDQGHHLRPLHLRPRRQPPDRPGAGDAELLGRGGRHGGLLPGRRCRAQHRRVDDRRRALDRRMGYGHRPLRRVRDARMGYGQVVGELRNAAS